MSGDPRPPEFDDETRLAHRAIRDRCASRPTLSQLRDLGEIDNETYGIASETLARGPDAVAPLATELKSERERLGLSSTELADRLSMSPDALVALENGEGPDPGVGALDQWARALGRRVALVPIESH